MINVNVEQFLRELELLVNMDSGQGNPGGITAVAQWFKNRFDALGWVTELVDVGRETGNCMVVRNREAAHYDALLVGHLDTVFPAGETARRPFRRDKHRAYGLGVLDMKQGCLAMLHVLEQLPPEVSAALNIAAIFNPDEEVGSPWSKALIDTYARRCDYAYVFEAASTDGSHCIQRKGRYTGHIQFHGQSGHAGYLLEGGMVSAVNELLYWAGQLNRHCSAAAGTSVNIGVIRGGQRANIVPDFAEMEFEARYERIEECERLLTTIDALKLHAARANVGVTFVTEKYVPPLEPTAHALRYAAHIRALSEAHGIPFAVKKRGGVSDANHIAACGPICVDGLGPTGDFDHSPREYLELSTIQPNLRFAWLLLQDLADQKEDI